MTLLVYIIDAGMLVDWKFALLSWVIILSVAVYFGKKYRNEEQGGFLPFGQSYIMSIIMLFINSLVAALFMILLYTVIDPEVTEVILEQTIENTESMLRSIGADDEAIDAAIERSETQMEESFTAIGIISNSWVYMLIASIFGLITGAIIKKNKPDFDYS